MKLFKPVLFVILSCLAVTATSLAQAQEGYPLNGTWRGQYGGSDAQNTAVVVMDWDGSAINGRINPGRNMLRFDQASLNAADWTVHIEATSKDGQPIVIDGVLENIGSYNRTITGTWNIAGVASAIVLTRE